MITEIWKNSIRFIILVLLQTLIVKNIPLGAYFVPMPYLLFILMLPFETMPMVVLFLSFFTGLAVDIFYDTQGVHASACVLMGYLRFYFLRLLSPREGYEVTEKPTVQFMGNTWFLSYAVPMLLVHHLFFFYLEEFGFDDFFFTLLKTLGSTLASFVFIYIIQFLFYRKDGVLA
ncbi:MAG: rod shape-determining protein MreD [Bacteroidetes bacterium]|jgi:rod shape-determining protein MreD|nr:rod shape-determining protein MreD [Bacteroidota bacterium]